MAELHALVMQEAAHDVEPRPGAVELVDALLDAGIPVAVASNSPRGVPGPRPAHRRASPTASP